MATYTCAEHMHCFRSAKDLSELEPRSEYGLIFAAPIHHLPQKGVVIRE
jgi:hypothetical protein